MLFFLEIRELSRELVIGNGKDLDCEITGVCSAVDTYGCNGNSGGHHNGREQGIHAFKRLCLDRECYYRQGGVCCKRAGEVSRHTCGADKYTETVFTGISCEFSGFGGGAVSRENVDLEGYTELFEDFGSLSYYGEVTVASHYYCNFFHDSDPHPASAQLLSGKKLVYTI